MLFETFFNIRIKKIIFVMVIMINNTQRENTGHIHSVEKNSTKKKRSHVQSSGPYKRGGTSICPYNPSERVPWYCCKTERWQRCVLHVYQTSRLFSMWCEIWVKCAQNGAPWKDLHPMVSTAGVEMALEYSSTTRTHRGTETASLLVSFLWSFYRRNR